MPVLLKLNSLNRRALGSTIEPNFRSFAVDVANGEGVYGLRRALSIAGAESQLITLWLVDDEATKDLMTSYYQRLQKNMSMSATLRQTQLEFLTSPQYQRPYYWAAFIPSGEWTSLNAKP